MAERPRTDRSGIRKIRSWCPGKSSSATYRSLRTSATRRSLTTSATSGDPRGRTRINGTTVVCERWLENGTPIQPLRLAQLEGRDDLPINHWHARLRVAGHSKE